MSQDNYLSDHVSFIDHSWDEPQAADGRTTSLGESTMASGERRGSAGAFRPNNHADLRDVVTIQSEIHGQNQGPSLRDKLVFDLDQAWQRSLMHHLEDLEGAMEEDHPRPRADRILLGHAESGDYALECEDDLTIVTETSLTLPTRMQMIHRTMRQIALFQDDEDDGDQTTDSSIYRSSKFAEPRDGINSSPRGVLEGPYGQNHVSDAAASSAKPIPLINLSEDEDGGIITTTTFTTMDDHRDESFIDRRTLFVEGSKPDLRPIPRQLPKNRSQDIMNHPSPPPPPPPAREVTLGSEVGDDDAVPVGIYRSPAFSEDLPLYYPSRKSTSMDDTDYMNEQGQAGCMCLGYNLLDFLLPESSPQVKYRHKKRRMSAPAPASQSINLRSSLGRVDEVLDESMMNADGEIIMDDIQVLEHSDSIHQHHSDQQYIQYDETRTSRQIFISNNGNDVYVHQA